MPPSQPLVSIVIVTRNRPRDVLRAIESCIAQDYESLEVSVYEDAADESVGPLLAERFPQVNFERSDVPVGPTGFRARGIASARGEIVFSIDDDAYFTDMLSVQKVVSQFQADGSIGAIALPLIEPSRHPDGVGYGAAHPIRPSKQLHTFMGGSVAYRRSAFVEIGGVRDCYRFLGGDENDVAIRLIDRGYSIVLGENAPVVHTVSPVRDLRFKFRNDCRSALLFDYLNAPFPAVVVSLAVHAVKLCTYKLTPATIGNRLASVGLGLWACVRFAHYRSPVSRSTYRMYRRLPAPGILPARAVRATEHCPA